MQGGLVRSTPAEEGPQHEPSNGIRGCVRRYIFHHMLDAVPGSFKVVICDSHAAAVLNCSLRVHDLMEHGVTLLEDLAAPRQPIISSPALYFFAPEEAAVRRVIEDWAAKDPYAEAHLFALGCTPERHLQQLAQARVAPRVVSFKDMLLEFSAPESLVFHLGMEDAFAPLLSPLPQPTREFVLDVAASRLVSVFHVLNSGVPFIHYQNRSNICHAFAKTFFEKLAKLCYDEPDFKKGENVRGKPVLVILDRGFDTVAPLVHQRTYQCLLDDLMPLENGVYEQTFKNRAGEDAKREYAIDEDDVYWCSYRHRFFAQCLEELPAALNELHAEHPALAQGLEKRTDLAELGGAVRGLLEFQEKQAKLSLHIDICSRLMGLYREQRLAEVCEVEQDIAAERRPFKENLESVRRLTKDAAIPEPVRLRLLLLFAAASNTEEFTEAKKQQLLQGCGLASKAHLFANLEQLTRRVGRTRCGGPAPERGERASSLSLPNAATDGDPFLNQAYAIMESVARNTLNSADYPAMSSPYEARTSAAGGEAATDTTVRKKTLRVGLSLAAMRQDHAVGQNGTGGGGGKYNGAAGANAEPFQKGRGKGENLLDLGGSGGMIALRNPQRIVLFVLGGVTCSERRAAYEISKKYGREVILGGTSMLRPEVFVQELGSLR
ncbi:putative syntaxin binding protein [Trypanosoma conorhini]|uniref:Putative syntaxin binding protein n=1 Tax=Trypanosoma conorhini TaxID=83891 RepID=A0A3R7M7H6_9TRYP|nr:putative syntaxin binding protein [Trypanosoma conorhini]RNE97575.1 putative syntaxin binding protein [Trypanosoma conorhini]